jgi:hypothetical protein
VMRFLFSFDGNVECVNVHIHFGWGGTCWIHISKRPQPNAVVGVSALSLEIPKYSSRLVYIWCTLRIVTHSIVDHRASYYTCGTDERTNERCLVTKARRLILGRLDI